MNLACVGHDIFVGNSDACDGSRGDFDRVIHIRYPGQVEGPGLCRCREGGPDDLVIEYSDTMSLTTASVPLGRVSEFARQPGTLLIHCAAGICRSPTYAVLAKIARGCDPFDAYRDVPKGLWEGYRTAPLLHHDPLGEILAWAETT
jgi:hypothetical protein